MSAFNVIRRFRSQKAMWSIRAARAPPSVRALTVNPQAQVQWKTFDLPGRHGVSTVERQRNVAANFSIASTLPGLSGIAT